MNNRNVLTAVAAYYLIHGIVLLFAPEVVLDLFSLSVSKEVMISAQFFGGSLFALGYLNWLLRNTVMGGIYGRPLVITNLSFFFISALTGVNARLSGFGNDLFWAEVFLLLIGSAFFGNILLSKSPEIK